MEGIRKLPATESVKKILSLLLIIIAAYSASAQPYGLRTDLVERTDIVYREGYLSSMTLEESSLCRKPVQYAEVASPRPSFSWIVDPGERQDVLQTAYRIVITRCEITAAEGKSQTKTEYQMVWDSGKVDSDRSSAVPYEGSPLAPSMVYRWKVKTWNNYKEESDWSEWKKFKTASTLSDDAVTIEPVVKTDQFAQSMGRLPDGNLFLDFGKAAFGQIRLTLNSEGRGKKIVLHIGERLKEGRVDRNPFGTCRYRRIELSLLPGVHTYRPEILPDYRNTHGEAVLMPDYIGEVMPFRYLEIEGYEGEITGTDVIRIAVNHPFDDLSSYFSSSSEVLNKVWDICKYSMKATSFTGYHIDGDRERIPYELDALINQLSWYGTDDSYSLSRRSAKHLLEHPTWPTEWILQTVLIAWYDYLYTGDSRLLASQYELLGRHTLLGLKCENGLISTTASSQSRDFLTGINRSDPISDIVDWPRGHGDFGSDRDYPGEADNFEFKDCNTVVNAYHYKALVCMADIAQALGKAEDAAEWANEADRVKKAFNKLLSDSRRGYYRDGVGTEHSALHSNIFPLAFGMVPDRMVPKICAYAFSRGMACSIANAKFFLDALYDCGCQDEAFALLSSRSDRSWYNPIQAGSTITFEAWDDKYKGNQDWNHAWGAAPADLLPHKLLGVEPTSAGWNIMRIKPQISSLEDVRATIPTIKGPVSVSIHNVDGNYSLAADIPANTLACVWVPVCKTAKGAVLTLNGRIIKAPKDPSGNYFIVSQVGSGHKVFTCRRQSEKSK